MTDVVLLYTTWPDGETAQAAARGAVEVGLAACVNVLAPAHSIYRWRGAVEAAVETPAVFKTNGRAAEALRDWIAERHPFETPAILSLGAGPASLPAYLAWVAAETSAQEPSQACGRSAAVLARRGP